MWKEARGEQEELRSTGRGTTCANPETDSCLERPLSPKRTDSRDALRKIVPIIL